LTVTKIGKNSGILVQADGTKTNVILKNYKHVPGLWVNLFSVTQAIASGWNLKSDGQMIMLIKGLDTIKFDRIMQTGDGYVCGVDIIPRVKAAASTLSEGSAIDINELHRILNHCGEDTLKLTAKAHGMILRGTLQPCFACRTGNARNKDVAKVIKVVEQIIGERLFIDILSVEQRAFDGARYWVLVVDDKIKK